MWEELIDHKKLPFMAMLRNLRNVIIAGISNQHHQWVIGRLTDERAVVNSRQFPFRFFSAYEVLNQLETREIAKPLMKGVIKGSNPLKKIRKVKETPSSESRGDKEIQKCSGHSIENSNQTQRQTNQRQHYRLVQCGKFYEQTLYVGSRSW